MTWLVLLPCWQTRGERAKVRLIFAKQGSDEIYKLDRDANNVVGASMRVRSRVSDHSISFILGNWERSPKHGTRWHVVCRDNPLLVCAVGVILEVWRSLSRTREGGEGGTRIPRPGGPIAWRSRSISAASWITQLTLLLKASRGDILCRWGPSDFYRATL